MSRLSAALVPFVLASLAACAAEPGPLDFSSGKRADSSPGSDSPAAPSAGGNQSKSVPGQPPISVRRAGVVFLHGTGDQGNGTTDYTCSGAGDQFHCEVKVAVEEYWVRATIDSEIKRVDGTPRPYAVLGCPLGSQTPWPNPTPVKGTGPEPGSAACTSVQIARFLDGPDAKAGTDDDITDVALVTHSGGSNVVRYILQQHAAKPEFERIHKASRGFIGIAAPTHGTYLADWVFRNGSLANKANGVIGFFGGETLYDDDGTNFIRTAAMSVFNRDPAKLVDIAKDVAGVPSFMAGGTYPSSRGDDVKVACAGATETKGLALLHELLLDTNDAATFRDGCSDGFISCRSAMALANGDPSRVLFGRLDDGRTVGKTLFRAHNQSRRQCNDTDLDIRRGVNAILTEGASPVPFAAQVSRTPYAASSLASDDLVDIVVDRAQAAARVVSTRVSEDDDEIALTVEVDVASAANLGVRATLVATDASDASFVIDAQQIAAPSSPGHATFTLRFPRRAARGGDHLSVRDIALVNHDVAATLAIIPLAR